MDTLAALSPEHTRLIVKLDSNSELTGAEKRAIGALRLTIRTYGADQDVVRDGDRVDRCCLLLDGFMHRYKTVQNGARQIMSFHIPGDMPDLQSLYLGRMDHAVGTLVPSRVAFVSHAAVQELAREFPGIGAALWRDTLIDSAVFREWIVNVGRRSAIQRISHLLCELYLRFKVVGLAGNASFSLPLTQAEIGDATGLSTVHVNRTLQELRADGLIASQGKIVQILNWTGLQHISGFDQTYLHFRSRGQT
ncbi:MULTISPECIES: Crp/Fnr family transcriptional regulator [Lichenihabitans]|uniref:Crp/Fnr family transcriptional regulator n=1 Tax=Lichenihabitans TaxID=2723776 RepID=UPI001036EEEF|nr:MULTISPECIES: Crp/Fnr family transcriptional regulator [Lichenihabitans]UDL94364.1 Crp/Fnr family transcriptional regulator [Lichenihabitans sp. PAMC28606]